MQQHLLTALILVPVIGALATVAYSFVPNRREEHYKWIALAFSTANVTSPRRPYGFRSSRAGTGTGAGREPPPQAAAEQSASNATVRHTVSVTGALRT